MQHLGLTLKKLVVGSLLLGSTFLLMGVTTGCEVQEPSAPVLFPSKVVWTPDGKHIFFSRGFQGIFRVDVAGSELQAIPADAPMGTASSPGNALPALSPDGTWLAYVAQRRGLEQSTSIMVSALDGTGARRLTRDEKFNSHPAWSPDGEEIAYIADGKLTVMRADGTNMRLLVPSIEAVDAAPVWSPDGNRIAFVGVQQVSAHRAVFTVRADGTGLTNLGATVSVPSWSPDGGRIGFLVSDDEEEVSLYTLDSVGADQQKIWSLGQVNARQAWSLVQTDRWYDNLSWSPDSSAILYVSADGEVEVVSLDYANEKLRFSFGDTVSTTPQKDLPGGTLARAPGRWAAWSPMGNGIAVLPGLYSNLSYIKAKPFSQAPDRSNLLIGLYGNSGSVTSQRNELYTMERDGALKRVLVLRSDEQLEAKHIGWHDAQRNIAACSEGFVVPNPDENPGLVADCETLMAIRDRLAGDLLLNWSAAVPLIEWWGVGVVYTYSEISPFRIGALYLVGKGPVSVGHMLALLLTFAQSPTPAQRALYGEYFGVPEGFDIGSKGLTGSIPRELGNLESLGYLDLSNNALRGTIPPELGNLSNLGTLFLHHNTLSGSIPPELGNLPLLETIDLSHNGLSGSIPPELGRFAGFRGIKKLFLEGNAFSGCVPVTLSRFEIRLEPDGFEFCE